MGAAALWQGFALRACELVLARGFSASLSKVELFVTGWGNGFLAQVSQRDEEGPPEPDAGDVDLALRAARGEEVGAPPSRATLPWSGWVSFAEVEDGKDWTGQYGPLYVVDAVEVKRSELPLTPAGRTVSGSTPQQAISIVRLTLACSRWRWGAGALARWSFNRRLPDGREAHDSLHPEGRPWRLSEVLSGVVGDLRGRPHLLRSPVRLVDLAPPVALAPSGPAVGALGDLVGQHGLEQPCLTWRGSVELYDPAEVTDVSDDGGSASEGLPPELRLWLQGQGQGHDVEQGWPADYVLVRGEPRVATARLDRWEAVLVLTDGRVVPLNEETLKALVPGPNPPGGYLTWMTWLSVWINGSRSHQGVPGLRRAVAQLLDAQAWRLYRIPGAVGKDGKPGPNAHLLPLLARAETGPDGRRLGVLVETFHFAPVHVEFAGTDARADAIRSARAALGAVQDAIGDAIAALRLSSPLSFAPLGEGPQGGPLGIGFLSPRATRDLLRGILDRTGLAFDDVAQAIGSARYLQKLRELSGDLAGQYERALEALYEAEGGTRAILLRAGKLIAGLEEQLSKATGLADTGIAADVALADHPSLAENVRRQLGELAQEVLAKQAELDLEARTGVRGGAPKPNSLLIHENLELELDPGASIYDEERGIVQTSRLAGWQDNPNRTDLRSTFFVPKPVRVTFGCVLRPRLDLLPGQKPVPPTIARTATPGGVGAVQPAAEPPLSTSDAPQPGDVIPTAVSDEESWYLRLFGRNAALLGEPDVVPLPPPQSEERAALLARATPVIAPLQELVPLPPAVGNVAVKNEEARNLAIGHLQRRQIIRANRLTVARPHRVRLDGVVAKVTIRSRDGFAGFLTEVTTGSSERALDPLRTMVRPKQGGRGSRDTLERGGAHP